MTMVTKETRDSELAGLTVSMLLSLAYFVTVCWVFPVIPMIVVLIYGLPFAAFMTIWLGGLPFAGLALYYFYRTKE